MPIGQMPYCGNRDTVITRSSDRTVERLQELNQTGQLLFVSDHVHIDNDGRDDLDRNGKGAS